MTNKKKIVLTILTCIFIALACIFGFTIANKQDLNVKADSDITVTTYTYSSGTLPFYLSTYTNNDWPDNTTFSSRWFNFSWIGSSGGNLNFLFDSSSIYRVSNINYTLLYSNIVYDTWTYIKLRNDYTLIGSTSQQSNLYVQYYFTSGFNFNVVSLRLFSERWGGVNSSVITTRLIYTDNNNKSLTFILFTGGDAESALYSDIVYTDRIYYIISSFTDNQYFNAGYDNGYSAGTSAGYDNGYSAGYDIGNNAGYNVGYSAGVEAANTYSFLGMIGAAFDVPINAFKEMFDFNVLGVNLKDFFLGIFSLIIIIFVVRLILGGK